MTGKERQEGTVRPTRAVARSTGVPLARWCGCRASGRCAGGSAYVSLILSAGHWVKANEGGACRCGMGWSDRATSDLELITLPRGSH